MAPVAWVQFPAPAPLPEAVGALHPSPPLAASVPHAPEGLLSILPQRAGEQMEGALTPGPAPSQSPVSSAHNLHFRSWQCLSILWSPRWFSKLLLSKGSGQPAWAPNPLLVPRLSMCSEVSTLLPSTGRRAAAPGGAWPFPGVKQALPHGLLPAGPGWWVRGLLPDSLLGSSPRQLWALGWTHNGRRRARKHHGGGKGASKKAKRGEGETGVPTRLPPAGLPARPAQPFQ